MTALERDSGVDIVHREFPEGSNSILGVFPCKTQQLLSSFSS